MVRVRNAIPAERHQAVVKTLYPRNKLVGEKVGLVKLMLARFSGELQIRHQAA